MLGMAAVRKAAKKGYKRYGIPGAVVAGLGTLVGIRFIKRKLQSSSGDSTGSDSTDSQTGTDAQ
jgi:hypothetical protein